MDNRLIYLDNAATRFPKPRTMLDRMVETYARMGVSPGRGSYDLSVETDDLVREARRKLARFFGAPDPTRVIFASNATDALNLAIQGLVAPGDHVVSTRLEHNSVLRPLYHLKARGTIDYDLVPFDRQGFVHPDDVASAIRPNTRLVQTSLELSSRFGRSPGSAPTAACRCCSIPRRALDWCQSTWPAGESARSPSPATSRS